MARQIIEINGLSPILDYDDIRMKMESEEFARFCENATIYSLNKFPVITNTNWTIDLLLIINIENSYGNYYRPAANIYFNNLILPIKILNYSSEEVKMEGDILTIDGDELDFTDEVNSLKFGLLNYLEHKCKFERSSLFINPLVFVLSDQTYHVGKTVVISQSLGFDEIMQFSLKHVNGNQILSYQPWKEHYHIGIENDVKGIIESASKDSLIGYLTKKKIDKFGDKKGKGETILSAAGNEFLLIEGKAGTGKTNLLLSSSMKLLENRQRTLFLTYNVLLSFEIAHLINSYLNNKSDLAENVGSSVLTVHSFMFRLARRLGAFVFMDSNRIKELLNIQDKRLNFLQHFFNTNKNTLIPISQDKKKTIEFIMNSGLSRELRDIAVKMIHYSKNIRMDIFDPALFKSYKDFNSEKLYQVFSQELFLKNYYKVLENILGLLNNTSSYYDENKGSELTELLSSTYNIKDVDSFTKADFVTKVNSKRGGFRHNRIVLVDEGQDCHRLERDILFNVFSSKRLIVSSGGREQLIRHAEVCQWTRSEGKAISHRVIKTGNKSYRLKKALSHLNNFISAFYKIDLNLETLESEDVGEVIIDFRGDLEYKPTIIHQFLSKGHINGCTPYESLLILTDTSQFSYADVREDFTINEHNNIERNTISQHGAWRWQEQIESVNPIWNGTVDGKAHNEIPYPGEVRLIHYESCRGLEAWCVACFDIDMFFDRKAGDEEADTYLMDTLLSIDERRKMFAATWLLMATTRAIDTLYLKCISKDSEIGRLLMDFAKQNPKYCRVLENDQDFRNYQRAVLRDQL